MYIILLQLKVLPLGHVCTGYVHKNKSGKYYSDAEHAFVFSNLNDTLMALQELVNSDHPKYKVLGWLICDPMKGPIELNNDVMEDIDALRAVIESIFYKHLSSKIDMSKFEFEVTSDSDSISIKFPGHTITVNKSQFEISTDKIYGTSLSRKMLILLTDDLIQDILVTVWNYMLGHPVDLLKFEED